MPRCAPVLRQFASAPCVGKSSNTFPTRPVAPSLKNLHRRPRSASYLIRVVLNGMAGPIEVGGRRYDAVMTPLRYLKDQQVADVLNFILTSWGNEALLPSDHKPFSPEEVARERPNVLSPRRVAEERPAL